MSKNISETKYHLMAVLSRHVGRANAIGMEELFREVFGEIPKNKINDTRRIRKLVEDMRREGLPICAVTDNDNSGYYLAAAGSELKDFCNRIRKRALKLLAMEAKLRKQTLPKLLGEIALTLEGEEMSK
jgi:hypothetical protein